MYSPNVEIILSQIKQGDIVLDIGGWALPFNRANYVIDMMPYETRGSWKENYAQGSQGGDTEYFDKTTWIQRDICDHTPFPFDDKSIDYVICSHTLEDLRDPIWVCSEMNRVGKRGYIEVPSRLAESSRGLLPGIVGWSHHRWLIDIDRENSKMSFLPKYHTIHGSSKFHFPAWFLYHLPEELKVQWLFWENKIEYEEKIIHGVGEIEFDLALFIRENEALVKQVKIKLGLRDWARYYQSQSRHALRHWSQRILTFVSCGIL